MSESQGGIRPQSRSFEDVARRPAKIRSESPGRMIPAWSYEGDPEDSIDTALASECRRLTSNAAQALQIRRIAQGEYEIDGEPVRLSWEDMERVRQVVVDRLGSGGGREPLSRYLPLVASNAFKKA